MKRTLYGVVAMIIAACLGIYVGHVENNMFTMAIGTALAVTGGFFMGLMK